ncbi:MAG: SRPBCC family protein [Pyrinomonadaceae bacterium]
MKRAIGLMSAAGIGAGLMYLFDPQRGKRRRAEIRNKAQYINRITNDAVGKTGRDLRNHILGVISGMESLVRSEKATDGVLKARVRSKLGRLVSHPHAIEVKAVDGRVILTGPILADEVVPLFEVISDIAGLKSIENLLELHENAGDVPALQGGKQRGGERFGPFKTTWSPTTRLVAGVAGGAFTIYGGKRRGALGSAIGTVGLGVLARALTNTETRRMVGVNGAIKGIDIEKTITIDAPIDKVFTYWSHPENFPAFMSHVRDVRRIDAGMYRWKVGGPAGLLVEWDAAITDLDFNKTLAWKSLPGSIVGQQGVTRFRANTDGSTRIDVKMSYMPPGGLLGHEIAKLFGVDPKHEMDDDLMRMKSFIETGVHPHDAADPPTMQASLSV